MMIGCLVKSVVCLRLLSFFFREKNGEKYKGGPGKIRIRGGLILGGDLKFKGGPLTPIDAMPW